MRPQEVNAPDQLAHSGLAGGRQPGNRCSPKTSSFSNTLADNGQNGGAAADRQPEHRLGHHLQGRGQSSGAVDKLNKLITGLSSDGPDRPGRDRAGQRGRALDRPRRLTGGRQALVTLSTNLPAGWHRTSTRTREPDITIQKAPKNYRSWFASAPTAASSISTCAGCRSASPIVGRKFNSPGSSNTREGARSPDAEIPWFLAHQVGLPRRGADHSGHRRRPATERILTWATSIKHQAPVHRGRWPGAG